MLSLVEIKELHDKAYVHGQTTREKAADDMMFYFLSQWDDNHLTNSNLQYRGQFDMLRKAGRQVATDIKANPTQVDFEPVDGTDDGGAEIIDGMYRSDMRNNVALEAKNNATGEAVVCGYGAWELYTKYKTNRAGDKRQVIRRRPLYEANNNVFWDPNAKLMDKSDADYVSCLIPYSEDGYKKMVKDLTGKDVTPSSFAFPEHSYVFPWIIDNDYYYVSRFYHRATNKITILIYQDVMGSERQIKESDLSSQEEDLLENGFEFVKEIKREITEVTLYIVGGGDEIIKAIPIAGENITVIPMYGERAIVEGNEHYEGIVRLAKDPQRLRNFQLSYLADMVARSPRPKPIFHQEQIQGFEFMYEESGVDNNFPYLLQNRKDAAGEDLPVGPVAQMPEQQMPTALVQSINLSREAINDVAAEGLPQNITDLDLSGEALVQIQKLFDKNSLTYQDNLKSALRRDGEVYASMASVVYDTEQEVQLTKPDGTRKSETINHEEIDPGTLKVVVNNDIRNAIFDVYAEVGPSFQSMKDQNRKELKEMINSEPQDSPMRQVMLLEYMTLQDGVMFENMRKYARKQLILQGIQEPETTEEIKMFQQAQQQAQQDQDPNMLIAQAEMGKAEAEKVNAQANLIDKNVDMFNAETNRSKVELDAGKFIEDKKTNLGVKGAELRQSQKKIDLQESKQMQEMALKLLELEAKLGQQLDSQVEENMLVFDPDVGDFVSA